MNDSMMTRRSVLLSVLAAVPFLVSAHTLQPSGVQEATVLTGEDAPAGAIWLDSLDLTRMVQRRGTPRAGRSGAGRGNNPPPLSLVLEVSQDVLGKGATRIYQRDRLELWARPLAEGTMAAGLFNRGLQAVKMRATWKELGLTGSQPVRDLWLQKDLGAMNGEFSTVVPAHGAVLVKIGRSNSIDTRR